MKPSVIPAPTIRRLSLYLRFLEDCANKGLQTVSSKQLGETLSLTDAQVRKDLAYFGPFGHPGIGYHVAELINRLRQILGTDRMWKVALVGAGNLGRSLTAYKGFAQKGFEITAVFDNDPSKVGQTFPGLEGVAIQHIDDLSTAAEREGIKLAILAVPAQHAQFVARQMIAAGIKGILNFAPMLLNVPDDVAVSGVDMSVHLEQLSFLVGGGGDQTTSGDE